MTGVEVGVDISQAEKIWRACTALGNIALACAYTFIAIDVQVRPTTLSFFFVDLPHSPPPPPFSLLHLQ